MIDWENSPLKLQLCVFGVVLSAFLVFVLKNVLGQKQISARIQKQGSSPFLGLYPMEFAYWALGPIGKAAAALNISPNVFSWLCFGLGLLSGIAAGFGHMGVAGGVGLISAIFDALDGMVARARGVASDAGEVLDAAVDRYTEFFFLAGVIVYYRFDFRAMLIAFFALLGSFMVSYSQAKAEALQITNIPKGFMRRPERAVYLGAGAFLSPVLITYTEYNVSQPFHYLVLIALILVGLFSNITAASRFVFLYKTLKSQNR